MLYAERIWKVVLMKPTLLVTAITVLAMAAAACSDGSPSDGPSSGGRLSANIINGELTECVYDALVTLEPGGVVKEVSSVGADAEGQIEPGMVVEGAGAVFPDGAGIPVPVHLDDEGVLRGSYASCETLSADGTPGGY